jgi:hypothetical protein
MNNTQLVKLLIDQQGNCNSPVAITCGNCPISTKCQTIKEIDYPVPLRYKDRLSIAIEYIQNIIRSSTK